jgi:hypothetical protein
VANTGNAGEKEPSRIKKTAQLCRWGQRHHGDQLAYTLFLFVEGLMKSCATARVGRIKMFDIRQIFGVFFAYFLA